MLLRPLCATALCLVLGCGGDPPAATAPPGGGAPDGIDWTQETGDGPAHGYQDRVSRYEYVLVPTGAYLYDLDDGHAFVRRLDIAELAGQPITGATMSPASGLLFVAYGGDGGSAGNGAVLAYDLVRDVVAWQRDYPHGAGSLAVSPDGATLYVPTGQRSDDSRWYLVDAADGSEHGSIASGVGAAHTIVGLSGERVYLGARYQLGLAVADTATREVIRLVGALWGGIMPFTVNGRETLAFTTSNGFIGFQVGDLATGAVIHDVPVAGFTAPPNWPHTPSHGISLSPDEREVYLIDHPGQAVHVFDVTGLPAAAPVQVAEIPITPMTGDEVPCAYDCGRAGWLHHSLDGRFVYVGDSGDVIDTRLRAPVANLPALRNSRVSLEIDWDGGRPIATSTRHGLGLVR